MVSIITKLIGCMLIALAFTITLDMSLPEQVVLQTGLILVFITPPSKA